jgi:hypothetical protein
MMKEDPLGLDGSFQDLEVNLVKMVMVAVVLILIRNTIRSEIKREREREREGERNGREEKAKVGKRGKALS